MASSDDDSFQGSDRKKTKRPSPAAYNDADDSDSDDSLLLGNNKPTFRSSSRLRKKPKQKMDAHLEDALKSRSIKMETQISMHRKIQRTKQETNLHDDELLKSARALKVKRDADRVEREKEKEQQVQEELQLLQNSVNVDGSTFNAPRRRNDLWLEVQDTELTRTIDTHFGLHVRTNRNLPNSTQKAHEYLEFVLDDDNKFGKSKLGKTLKSHLKSETLNDFMANKRLNRTSLDTKSLPKSFLRWMLEVAVATCSKTNDTTFDKLSRGAYQTLLDLWSSGKGLATQGCLLAISDLPIQLEEWFGMELSTGDSKKNPQSPTSVASAWKDEETIPKSLASLSITRFLHLWHLALEHDMVQFSENGKKQNFLSDSIVALLLVSLDPSVFESTDTLGCCEPSKTLRQILGHLFQIAKATEKNPTWTPHLATRILDRVGSGGVSRRSLKNNNNDTSSVQRTTWSDQARMVNVLCHTKGTSVLVAHLCERLVAQVCKDNKKKSSSSSLTNHWETMIRKELENLQGWSPFATISRVVFLVVDSLPNHGETHVPAALIELLLEAMIMALQQLKIGIRGETTNLEATSKYAFFHFLDTVLMELTVKSKALTANNPDYLKVNYHTSCFRQYTRLETQKYKITEHQSTLDGFFTKGK